MSTDTKTKICRDCHVAKPLTDYYKLRNGTRNICKPCDITNRRKYTLNSNYVHRGKKKCAFELMPLEQQENIKSDLHSMTVTDVASKYNINRANLYYWKKKGVI